MIYQNEEVSLYETRLEPLESTPCFATVDIDKYGQYFNRVYYTLLRNYYQETVINTVDTVIQDS